VKKLIDNYGQARGCMSRMETRLLKKGRIAEFNRQFQDNVDRGVFKPIPREEADRYKGAVNYISMVEAFKTSPFATTPLRICMNSSMKQPQPSGVSLNDCLLKGPPALADLYTVTLGIREHKVAFTKDISKFYQCVEADEAAQHVRRILWRFGDRSREPTIFVTTRVNYGDRPAGCIAIAAVRETVSRFGEGKETAAWFLKNRMYVDDANGGASSMKEAKQVSQDMGDILENSGFRFKETVMAGDPLEEGVRAAEGAGAEMGHAGGQNMHGHQAQLRREGEGSLPGRRCPTSGPRERIATGYNAQGAMESGSEPVRPPRPPQRVHGEVETADEKSDSQREGGGLGDPAGRRGGGGIRAAAA
jgi:hypothetical protein